MQFRAIGLLRARYVVSDDQLSRGHLVTTDGIEISTVILGRVVSLVKKHIDLSQEHLWVVYPRTDDRSQKLQVQVVGVWEPETLQSRPPTLETNPTGGLQAVPPKSPVVDSHHLPDGYFSVRGEVVYQSAEKEQIVVKVKQVSRKDPKKGRAFKLKLQGQVEQKALHQFWDFQVYRQGEQLVIHESTFVAKMPPKKAKKKNNRRIPSRPTRRPLGDLGEKRPVGKPVPASHRREGANGGDGLAVPSPAPETL